ncbi:MAG: HAMP domain-containing histidine kinase [Pelagimonas sp.]|jgi:signal transduction histidine kinase|nr:HAMP domain-containing histidine kinase [Pelagimonas sp.]
MRPIFTLTLARQLALIVMVAVAGVQILALVLERRFEEALDLDRGLGTSRTQAANAIALLPSLPAETHADIVRSYTSRTTQFFLLPDVLLRPDAERVPELEDETRAWAARRNLAIQDVVVARHLYHHRKQSGGPAQSRPGAETGVPARLPKGFAMGEPPRTRMAEMIAHPPRWLHIRETPTGYQLKPIPPESALNLDDPRPVTTVAMQLASTGDWVTFYRFRRPPPNNDTVLKMMIALVGSVVIAGLAVLIGRRVIAPFRQLAESAAQLGRGERAAALPVSGPSDVRDVIQAFNRMNDQVSQSIDYQIGLLRSLGHDIKGPLAAADRLLSEVRPDTTRAQIEARLFRVRSIVDAIMNFSRAIMRDGEAEPTDLVEMLETLVAEQDENGEDAVLQAPESLPILCRVDATERALRNLIENAIKYGKSARVTVFVENGFAVVWIEDDGPGIPPEMLDAVFDPFLRLESDDTGSGLGLAITRTIALDQGGRVHLQNLPTGGLRASLSLPLT